MYVCIYLFYFIFFSIALGLRVGKPCISTSDTLCEPLDDRDTPTQDRSIRQSFTSVAFKIALVLAICAVFGLIYRCMACCFGKKCAQQCCKVCTECLVPCLESCDFGDLML